MLEYAIIIHFSTPLIFMPSRCLCLWHLMWEKQGAFFPSASVLLPSIAVMEQGRQSEWTSLRMGQQRFDPITNILTGNCIFSELEYMLPFPIMVALSSSPPILSTVQFPVICGSQIDCGHPFPCRNEVFHHAFKQDKRKMPLSRPF